MRSLGPGDRFGRYVIEELLGTGGMGQVYKARDRTLHRLVALKVLHAERVLEDDGGAQATERLFREARAAAALDHPNAVSIFDVGEIEGSPFIAMELVSGKTLRAMVGDARVPMRERLRWLADVARALAAAHARGLVHRDIKPENVMLRDDGTIKVLDFGIARRTAPAEAATLNTDGAPVATLTREGALLGTPRYMAPEQLRGETADARADQFAWGVMAYELLSGRAPWPGDATSFRLVAAILVDEPTPLGRVATDVPPEVEKVVVRALAKDRDARFPAMGEIVSALAPFVGGVASAPSLEPAHVAEGRAATHSGAAISARIPGPRRAPRVGWLLGAAAVVVAAVVVTGVVARRSDEGPSLASSAASAEQTQLVTMGELPVPETTNAEARAAYVAGLQAMRDASIIPGVKAFVRAAQSDPMMAAAHLRAHLYGSHFSEGQDGHFKKAVELRAALTPRDRAIVDALSPAYLAMPPDHAEASRRIDALARERPNDLEIAYLAASFEADKEKRAARLESLAHADPKFALPLWMLANDRFLARPDDAEAIAALLDRCLAVAPSASCLGMRVALHEDRGECADMEADAQRLLSVTEASWRNYDSLARALAARGAPVDAVRAALAQKWAASPPDDARVLQMQDEAALAVLRGDFAEAAARAQAYADVEASDARESEHEKPAWMLAEIDDEIGKPDRAAKIADDFLKKRAGWKSMGAWSPRPLFFSYAARDGLRTQAERAADLDAWLREWKTDPSFLAQRWVHGYAFSAFTKEDAVAALAAAPDPVPRVAYHQFHRESLDAVGRVYLLAGRAHDALPHLRSAAASCSALAAPIAHTRANLYLGQALESDGDVTGACAAYAVVLSRWGAASPRSVSAELARSRSAALRCRKE